MEGDFIKLKKGLTPLSWIYGFVVGVRNWLFDIGVLKSKAFGIPVIAVGNITVGGAGKTPHVEYLISLLKDKAKVAVLSRGYKRKSKGYVLATDESDALQIGDEPYQMKRKYPFAYIAVDKDRCEGIERLQSDEATKDTDVVLLDDAFQHRYVKPGVNILLVDYHRLIIYDRLLPVGRLRESQSARKRADIIIVTKCPTSLKPMEFRVLQKAMSPMAYQKLYYTTIKYECLRPINGGDDLPMTTITADTNILLLTGIASPEQMVTDLGELTEKITPLTFADHHRFKKKDIQRINDAFAEMPSPKLIVTTEKDATRLELCEGLSDEVMSSLYTLPIHVEFMLDQKETFDSQIISYVRKNSRNSILLKKTGKQKPKENEDNGEATHKISFRSN